MAAGDRLLGSDGSQILDASGNLQLSDGAGDDCCCGGGSDCGCCGLETPPASTPTTWTVVIAGVTPCTGCLDSGGGQYFKLVGDPNGTHTVTGGSATGTNLCLWDVTTSATVDIYSDSSCTTLVSSNPIHVEVWLGNGCTTQLVRVHALSNIFVFFNGNVTPVTCAASASGIANTLTSCGFATLRIGYNGTASITPNP